VQKRKCHRPCWRPKPASRPYQSCGMVLIITYQQILHSFHIKSHLFIFIFLYLLLKFPLMCLTGTHVEVTSRVSWMGSTASLLLCTQPNPNTKVPSGWMTGGPLLDFISSYTPYSGSVRATLLGKFKIRLLTFCFYASGTLTATD
jgi:hypothetical protein